MTSPTQIRNDMRQLREENNAAHDRLDERSAERHTLVMEQLRSMNGTQKEHSVRIAQLEVQQSHNCKELVTAKSERSAIWKLVRSIDKHRARQAGWIAGVALVVVTLMEVVVRPLLATWLKGGG